MSSAERNPFGAIREGQIVKSEVRSAGKLPESFSDLSIESCDNWVVGVGLLVDSNSVTVDPDLTRFFAHFDVPLYNPEERTSPQQKAIGDVVDQIVTDYRNSELFKKHSDVPHQLYGEISRRDVAAKDTPPSEYDDAIPHVDFVPSETLCRGYFFSDNNPTQFFEGNFKFAGNLHTEDYTKPEWQPADGSPVLVGPGKFPSGMLYVAPDARTLVHKANVTEPGKRVFGRVFGDLKR